MDFSLIIKTTTDMDATMFIKMTNRFKGVNFCITANGKEYYAYKSVTALSGAYGMHTDTYNIERIIIYHADMLMYYNNNGTKMAVVLPYANIESVVFYENGVDETIPPMCNMEILDLR